MTHTDDHAAVRERAAIGSISKRSQIAVAGPDRAAYLQGLLTNDIQALTAGTGCYAAWLSPQGRMLTDLHVLESGTMILLDVPAELADATMARLDQFLFSEDVRLESLAGTLEGVWIHGPGAAAVLEQVVAGVSGLAEWNNYQHATATFDSGPVSVARIDQIGVPGYCVFLPVGVRDAFIASAAGAGAVAVSEEALHASRIEAGYPVFGVDMTDDTIPLEAGIEDRAISFTKGCFVGQEVVIRVMHRGGGRVAKRLVGFKIDGEAAPGATLLSAERQVGVLTSVATSPRLGTIALGYSHRDFTSPGTELRVDGHHAVVSTLPM
jgi:folate-binding protein YgfZ